MIQYIDNKEIYNICEGCKAIWFPKEDDKVFCEDCIAHVKSVIETGGEA